MADTTEMNAAQLEMIQLRAELEQINAEKSVMQEALSQILNANIQVQTQNVLHQKHTEALAAENEELRKTVNDLMQKLAIANKVIEASTNLKAGDEATLVDPHAPAV